MSGFLSANMHIVFFVYGLAFFVLGLVVALESWRASDRRLGHALAYLALFGLLTSFLAWTDMSTLSAGSAPALTTAHRLAPSNCLSCHADPAFVAGTSGQGGELVLDALRLTLLVASAVVLATFGSTLLRKENSPRWLRLLPLGLLSLWLVSLVPLRALAFTTAAQWLVNAGILARYTLLLPAFGIAGLGLFGERTRWRRVGPPQMGRYYLWLGTLLCLSGVAAGAIVPPAPYPPASVLNYASFFAVTGIPIQVVRALLAIAIAYVAVRVLRVMSAEYDRQLQTAIQQKMRAQEEAIAAHESARSDIEAWNKELEAKVRQRTQELEERNHKLTAINSIANTVSQTMNLRDLLTSMLADVSNLVGASAGAVFLLDESSDELSLETTSGTPPLHQSFPRRVPKGQGCLGLCAAEARAVRKPLGIGEHVFTAAHRCGPGICVPLLSKGRVLGVMVLLVEEGRQVPPQDADMLEAIGGQVGVAIENARLFEQVEQLATLTERERLARELHDGPAQMLAYLNLRMTMAEDMLAKGRQADLSAELRHSASVTQDAYADVREAISGLRAPISGSLTVSIGDYLRKFQQQSGIDAELRAEMETPPHLEPEATLQLMRIVQEALSNVRKHASAPRAWVTLQVREGEIEVTIGDDGVGFDARATAMRDGHFGLQTMRERAESAGGTLEVQSLPGRGTLVTARIPAIVEGGRDGPHNDAVGGRSCFVS
ncbi:MAG: ATP-binding protein [Chloroflexota bacterium]